MIDKLKIIIPSSKNSLDKKSVIDNFIKNEELEPFSDVVIDFITDFSKRILTDSEYRRFPEIQAVAFWFRNSNLSKIKNNYFISDKNYIRNAKGTIYHIAPSNVDTIFIYSWFISLLAGNKNIIRLSSKEKNQLDSIFSIINSMFENEKYIDLALRNILVKYDHSEELTNYLSGICDLRVIWGGDSTIKQIRKADLPPYSTDLTFSNRTSFAIFEASKVSSLDEEEMSKLVSNFYKDTFSFAQQACSSPKSIFWIGLEQDISVSKEKFWRAFDNYFLIKSKDNEFDISSRVNRFVSTNLIFLEGDGIKLSPDTKYYSNTIKIDVPQINKDLQKNHGGNGLFFQVDLNNIYDINRNLLKSDQTAVIYGFNEERIHQLNCLLAKNGIKRIVTPGQALDFHIIWDGIDIFDSFSRKTFISL